MNKIELLEENFYDFLSCTTKVGSGTEAEVLLYDKTIYKIFNTNYNKSRNMHRIRKLSKFKDLEDYITLPKEEIYLDYKFIGYTMDYEGETIVDYLLQNNVSEEDKLDILFKVKQALEALHNKDMIHGDIHATNILINENQNVKITDINNIVFRNSICGYLNKLSKMLQPYLGLSKELDIMCYNYMAYVIMCMPEKYYRGYLNLGNMAYLGIDKFNTKEEYFEKDFVEEQKRIILQPSKKDRKNIDYITNHLI